MSTTFIERLLAAGDAVTGKVLRALGAKDPSGNAAPILVDANGDLRVRRLGVDPFGRIVTAEPRALIVLKQDKEAVADLYSVDDSVVGGSVAYDSNTASRTLTAGTSVGTRATFQSREYASYQPGRTQQVIVTGTLGANVVNVVKEMGYFDDSNGIYLEQASDGTMNLVIRSDTSGAVVETRVAQASWSVDQFDGSGPSGRTYDVTKFTVLVIEFGWLGGAGVRVAFAYDTEIVAAHVFNTAGNTAPFIRTPQLPLRWQIRGPAASAGDTMKATCGAVYSLGANSLGDPTVSRIMETGRSVSTTWVPLLSIRLKAGLTRGHIDPLDFSVLTTDNVSLLVKIMVRGTLGGSPSWSATTGPLTEYDESATSLTGGVNVASVPVERSGGRSASKEIKAQVRPSSDFAGVADVLTLMVRTVAGTGTIFGSLTWNEV